MKAPDASEETSCEAVAIEPCFFERFEMKGAGGATTTRVFRAFAALLDTDEKIARAWARESGFIFQLPTIKKPLWAMRAVYHSEAALSTSSMVVSPRAAARMPSSTSVIAPSLRAAASISAALALRAMSDWIAEDIGSTS